LCNNKKEVEMQLSFRESGRENTESILFLHGSPLSSRMWQPQMERLTGYHCFAPDLPGHGGSKMAFSSMPDLVAVLADFIELHVPEKQVHLVGLSFGGVVAQALMVVRPDLIKKVILSGTSTRLGRLLVALQALNTPILRLMSAKQMSRMIGKQFGIPDSFAPDLYADMEAFNPEGFPEMMRAYAGIEMPDNFSKPVLVVVGGQETFVAKKAACDISRSLPNARAVQAPGLGHVWNMQAAELFTDMVRLWVSDTALPEYLIEMS
jgi:pimeloyl-ACP methyl ester carboxylesterase